MDNNAETMTVSRVLRKGRSSLFRLLLMAGLLTLAASCSDGSVYSSRFETIVPSGWVKDKPLEFDLPDSLPATTFDIVLDVRHNNNYAYRNLWVTVDYVSHRQVVASDTVNVELADKYGNWYGSGLGQLFQYGRTIRRNVPVGQYEKVILWHTMRCDTVEHISDVGIVLMSGTDNK